MTDRPRYVPQKRYVWVEYTDPDMGEDAPAIHLYMRSDITTFESDELKVEEDDKREVPVFWEMVAPYVKDWNLDDEDGNPIPPPAEAGGMQFNYIPNSIFWRIYRDLRWNSVGKLDAKRMAPGSLTLLRPTEDGATPTTASTKRSAKKAS